MVRIEGRGGRGENQSRATMQGGGGEIVAGGGVSRGYEASGWNGEEWLAAKEQG